MTTSSLKEIPDRESCPFCTVCAGFLFGRPHGSSLHQTARLWFRDLERIEEDMVRPDAAVMGYGVDRTVAILFSETEPGFVTEVSAPDFRRWVFEVSSCALEVSQYRPGGRVVPCCASVFIDLDHKDFLAIDHAEATFRSEVEAAAAALGRISP